jgi:hypothetical protein
MIIPNVLIALFLIVLVLFFSRWFINKRHADSHNSHNSHALERGRKHSNRQHITATHKVGRSAKSLNSFSPQTPSYEKSVVCAILFLSLLLAFFQARGLLVSPNAYNWDPRGVWNVVSSYEHGKGFEDVEYLKKNSNNAFLVLVTFVVTKTGTVFMNLSLEQVYALSIMFLNIGIVIISQLIIYLILWRTTKSFPVSIFGISLSIIPLTFNSYISTPYSDIIGILPPLLATYLIVILLEKIKKNAPLWQKILLTLGISVLSGIGFLLKPITVAPAIVCLLLILIAKTPHTFASLPFGFLKSKFRLSLLSKAIFACVLLIPILLTSSVFVFTWDSLHLSQPTLQKMEESTPKKIDHFLAMGLTGSGKWQPSNRGAYIPAVVKKTYSMKDNPNERFSYNLEYAKEQVVNRGLVGNYAFLWNKEGTTIGDGTFSAWIEGSGKKIFSSGTYYNDSISKAFRNNEIGDGVGKVTLNNAKQIAWLVVLALIALQVVFLKSKNKAWRDTFDVRFVLYGIISMFILYEVFFESRGRYSIVFIPIFVLVASYTLFGLAKRHNLN